MKPLLPNPQHRKVHDPLSEIRDILKIKKVEIEKMIKRAKSSGEYHGINLKHGTPNQAAGDCAFEAIIQNNKLGLSWAKLSHSWGWALDKLE